MTNNEMTAKEFIEQKINEHEEYIRNDYNEWLDDKNPLGDLSFAHMLRVTHPDIYLK